MVTGPERIGRYHVNAVVGAGAFTTVYRAFDERLEDTVALKVLAENHRLDPEVRERFLTEGRVLRRVDSPHVVTVHDLGETARQQPYLVLELADLGTLANRVGELRASGWRPTATDVRALAQSVAAALEAVHSAQIVHRDLSPGNVLLRSSRAGVHSPSLLSSITGGGVLFLADLGMCKDLALHTGHTAGGGTEGFRPSEQRVRLAAIDSTADLWALSALTVWLVTGRPPDGGSVREPVVAAGFPGALAAVLDKSLSEDPRSRHQDPCAWLDAVTEALAAYDAGPPSAPSDRSASDRAAQGRRGWAQRVVIGTVALLVVVVGALAFWSFPRGPQITDLANGQVRVARVDRGVEVAIVGPRKVPAGDIAVFEAQLDGAETSVWVTPDREIFNGTRYLEVSTGSSGVAPVTLIGVPAAAAPIVVTHELHVTDAE